MSSKSVTGQIICLLGHIVFLLADFSYAMTLTATIPPDCSGGFHRNKGNLSTLYQGCNTIGAGVHFSRENVTHPYVSPFARVCWADVFLTFAVVTESQWQPVTGQEGCAKTDSCSLALASTLQQCTTYSRAVSKKLSSSIQATLEGLGFTFESESEITVTVSNQSCVTHSSTQSYQFKDRGCHVLCGQQKVLAVYGYKAQVCNYDIFRRKSHDHTVCMEDLVMSFPIDDANPNINSNGTCTDNPCQDLEYSGPPYGVPASCYPFNNTIPFKNRNGAHMVI